MQPFDTVGYGSQGGPSQLRWATVEMTTRGSDGAQTLPTAAGIGALALGPSACKRSDPHLWT